MEGLIMDDKYIYCGKKCIYCGSTNIEKNLSVGFGNSKTGLKYIQLAMPRMEPFYADLCKDCGSVRLYVKDSEKPWA